jgi:hypothetical protein
MNKLALSLLTAGIILAGTQAIANDVAKDSASKQQWKDCMDRQSAKNDGSSKAIMKKACTDELKTSSTSNTATNGASSDSSTTTGTAPTGTMTNQATKGPTTEPTAPATDSSTTPAK